MKSKSFKKVLAVIAAMVMPLSMSLVAFAQPSVSVDGILQGTPTVTDAGGKTVKGIVRNIDESEYTQAQLDGIWAIKDAATLQKLMGSKYTTSMKVLDVKEFAIVESGVAGSQTSLRSTTTPTASTTTAAGTTAKLVTATSNAATFPCDVTVNATGITSSSKVYEASYDKATSSWELLDATAGDGTVTCKLTHVGPIALIADTNTVGAANKTVATTPTSSTTANTNTNANTTNSGSKIPNTGDNTNIMLYVGIAAAAVVVGGATVVVMRKKRNK